MNLAPVLDDADELDSGPGMTVPRASNEGADDGATKAPAKSLPRAVPVARTPDPTVPVSNFGGVPENATHWRVRRRVLGGGWEHLSHAEHGSIAAVSVWPLSELSEELLQARWGAGRYEVQWVKPMPGGGSRVLRGGRQIDILPPPPPPSPQPSTPGVTFGPEVDRTLQMMRMITTEADAKMSSVLQFAAALAGRQNNGFGAAELELIMRNNREAVAAAVAPIQAELASLRRELDAEESDDEGTGLAGAAASAAASAGMLKGKGAWVQAANFAAGNPELVKAALPIVADTLGKIASIFLPKEAPKERPRAVPQVQAAPPPPPPVVAPAPPPPPPPPVVAAPPAPPVVAAPPAPEPAPALVFLDANANGGAS